MPDYAAVKASFHYGSQDAPNTSIGIWWRGRPQQKHRHKHQRKTCARDFHYDKNTSTGIGINSSEGPKQHKDNGKNKYKHNGSEDAYNTSIKQNDDHDTRISPSTQVLA